MLLILLSLLTVDTVGWNSLDNYIPLLSGASSTIRMSLLCPQGPSLPVGPFKKDKMKKSQANQMQHFFL